MIQIESVEEWASECKDLVYDHWVELGLDLDLEIAPDYGKMKVMEEVGMFKVITVRQEGRMVGYLLAIVSRHLHYRNSSDMFLIDAYYIAPAARSGTGVKLLKFMEQYAKSLGCIKIYLTCKVHKDHSPLFKALGYSLSDLCFIKRV